MKLSVLYTFFSEQELRVSMAIFKSFHFLLLLNHRNQCKRFLLVPPTQIPFLFSLHFSSVILIIKYSLIFQGFLLSSYNSRSRKVFAAF